MSKRMMALGALMISATFTGTATAQQAGPPEQQAATEQAILAQALASQGGSGLRRRAGAAHAPSLQHARDLAGRSGRLLT